MTIIYATVTIAIIMQMIYMLNTPDRKQRQAERNAIMGLRKMMIDKLYDKLETNGTYWEIHTSGTWCGVHGSTHLVPKFNYSKRSAAELVYDRGWRVDEKGRTYEK